MRTMIMAAFLIVSIIMFATPAQAKPNAVSAAETVGLRAVGVSQPVFTENLPETTTLDPSALAAKPPKMKKDDAAIGTTVEKPATKAEKPGKAEKPAGKQKATK